MFQAPSASARASIAPLRRSQRPRLCHSSRESACAREKGAIIREAWCWEFRCGISPATQRIGILQRSVQRDPHNSAVDGAYFLLFIWKLGPEPSILPGVAWRLQDKQTQGYGLHYAAKGSAGDTKRSLVKLPCHATRGPAWPYCALSKASSRAHL